MNLPFLTNSSNFFSFTKLEENGLWHVIDSFILIGGWGGGGAKINPNIKNPEKVPGGKVFG